MPSMLLANWAADHESIQQASNTKNSSVLIQRIHRLHDSTHFYSGQKLYVGYRSKNLLKQGSFHIYADLGELEEAISRLSKEARSTA